MQNKKRTKLISVLIILLCLSLCVGATYAYFTDSVKSDGNIIKSGKLDVTMEWANGTADPDGENTVWTDASKGAIFNYDLWEPGYTEVRHIRIKNAGNLAFQYKLVIVANGEVTELADVIDVYYFDPAIQVEDREVLANETPLGNLTAALAGMDQTATGNLKAGEFVTVTIALKMQEDAGNNYQNKSIGSDFSIQLYATQYTYESDAFDDQYDAGATFPSNGNNTPETTTPEETTPEPDEPTNQPEPTDPEVFDWRINDDGTYTCYGINSDIAMFNSHPENLVIPSTYQNLPVTAVDFWGWMEDKITSITIPDSVFTVGGFDNLQALQRIVLGNNVTTIKEYSFGMENKITEILIPDSVITIGAYASSRCSSLQSLTIGNGVTTIGAYAFQYCTSLQSLTIGNGVTTIGDRAFDSCSNLTSITFAGTVDQWNAISFGDRWNDNVPATEVVCSNGTVPLN